MCYHFRSSERIALCVVSPKMELCLITFFTCFFLEQVMREDNDIWLDGIMHLTVGVEVLG